MPLPFVLGAVAAKVVLGVGIAAGAAGVAKGVKGVVDSSEAKGVQERAEDLLSSAEWSLKKQKDKTSEAIEELGKEKINILAKDINDFVISYQKIKNVQLADSVGIEELKKLNFSNQEIKQMQTVSLGAVKVLAGMGTGAAAGVLLGWGTYGGVMALGTASTGTAIGALSGAAATNATLAWLGGGALAAGGGGMALGTAVMGGLVAGPALLIAGGLFSSKAKEQLNNAKSNLAEARRISEELSLAEVELKFIAEYAQELTSVLKRTSNIFKISLNNMVSIIKDKTDWTSYTDEEKHVVASTVKQAMLLKGIIDTPLLTNDGRLSAEVKQIVVENR